MTRVVVVGSGNLAESLACALKKSPLELVQIYGRNRERVAEVARLAGTVGESDPAKLARADLYLIAVSDRAVGEVAAQLHLPEEAVVAHTAGSVSMDLLPFARRGVFYPMQTFTKGRRVDFSQIPIFIEGASPEVAACLEAAAGQLSCKVIRADSEQRRKIHLAAVFACNFANAMYGMGERIVRSAGLDFEVLKPLIAETAAKAGDARSPHDVQTGPAVRHDLMTEHHHEALLADDPTLQMLYRTISQYIWETSKKI